MNLSEDIQRAIVALYKTSTWLTANTSGIYFYEAPDKTEFPYTVFELSIDYNHFAGGNSQVNTIYFKSFSDEISSKEINDICENIKTVFEGAILALSNHTLAIKPQIVTEVIEKNDSNVWQGTLIFNFQTV